VSNVKIRPETLCLIAGLVFEVSATSAHVATVALSKKSFV
jgi:hypothetical protein